MQHYSISKKVNEAADGKLIREFVQEKLQISRTLLTAIKFKGGKILVNGEEKSVRYCLQKDDELTIIFPEEARSTSLHGEELPLDIVYEDDDLLVVNKRAGMPTIPSREHPSGTLANALIHYYEKTKVPGTVHVVNRLDKDTSGLLLIAKNRYVHQLFSLQQRKRWIKRTYFAIADGVILEEQGKIDQPIGRKQDSIIEREVRADGQAALTFYHVVNRLTNNTAVTLRLQTGRTHQIRVHLASLGHPLTGDDLYGGSTNILKRQALHSLRLTFFHPLKERVYSFESSIPEDMRRIIEKS